MEKLDVVLRERPLLSLLERMRVVVDCVHLLCKERIQVRSHAATAAEVDYRLTGNVLEREHIAFDIHLELEKARLVWSEVFACDFHIYS